MVAVARKGIVTVSRNYEVSDTLLHFTVLEPFLLSNAIRYWATECHDEPNNRRLYVFYPDNEGDPTVGTPAYIGYDKIVEAMAELAFGERRIARRDIHEAVARFFREVDDPEEDFPGGDIDSEVGDVIIQLALFGDIIYG